jgi:SagB-type dehydrogenase family enzyme
MAAVPGVRRLFQPVQGGRLSDGIELSNLDTVLAYHQRTKHRLERFALGPEALDWSGQPDPFRSFAGSPRIDLPLAGDSLITPYSALFDNPPPSPRPFSLESVGALLELSMGLSAWKELGPDRWSVRCNPSSGNLHPTEAYVLCRGISGLDDGVYHYQSRDHVLEQRCGYTAGGASSLLVGLSSIHWREAWKYGERAFRYCQLDVGHALGALRYAAALLGWGLRVVEGSGTAEAAGRMGLDRDDAFISAESEEPEFLLKITLPGQSGQTETLATDTADGAWSGRANVLDTHPMYHWPVIKEVANASRALKLVGDAPTDVSPLPPRAVAIAEPAAKLIRGRRSAQRFDKRETLKRQDFYYLLDALLPRPAPPWDVWGFSPCLHPVIFVHRVEGLAPGLYCLPRRAKVLDGLKKAMHGDYAWTRPTDCPRLLPLFMLTTADCGQVAKAIHCHQAIATDSAFTLGMIAEFAEVLANAPWRYRQLHWEAGLIGQSLYLEAEALGLRGTGIGCYFDDSFHELLGLSGTAFQSLYHFTVGFPLVDSRISTLPPYPDRAA